MWRLSLVTDGCYILIGFNIFELFPLPPTNSVSADRGILVGVTMESERIEVQPGDVVGFLLTNIQIGNIEFANDSNYENEDVRYAANDKVTLQTPACPFPAHPQRYLNSSTNLAPFITATIGES